MVVLVLAIAKWAAQLWLEWLNQKHVRARAGSVPAVFRGVVDESTYKKSVAYTLARSRLDQVQTTWNALVLLVLLFSGLLPAVYLWFDRHLGGSAWSMAAFLFAIGVALSLPGLPLDWYEQFRLEAR